MAAVSHAPVAAFQAALKGLYGLEAEADAHDFMITVAEAEQTGLGLKPGQGEAVFVVPGEAETRVAVYISEDALAAALPGHPRDADLANLCLVAEAVSHFLLICDRARDGRQVPLVELELQAEVDKFALFTLWALDGGAGVAAAVAGDPAHWARRLLARLFDGVSYLPGLEGDELERYQIANREARRYCGFLARHYAAPARRGPFVRELRRFHRQGLGSKLARIARAAAI